MELRKNPKIDLERKRSAFFNIGLAISLMLVVSAFEWRFYGDGGLVDLGEVKDDFDKFIEIPPTVIPPPPPPVVELPQIVVVDDEEILDEVPEVTIDVELNENDIFEDAIFDEPLPPEVAEEVLIFVESMPEPVGGMQTFYRHVGKQMKYPNQARRMGVEGKVFVQFVVDKKGKLIEVKAVKGIGAGCDEEAVRVIKNSPSWTPGKQRGRPVKVRMILPVTFQLN